MSGFGAVTELLLTNRLLANHDFRLTAGRIAAIQSRDGAIPWFDGGLVDPWNHVEAAMGLSIAGYHREAERAYRWLRRTQLSDGSWWSAYRDGSPEESSHRESNSVAYIASGVWHHYVITRDLAFLLRMWPTVEAALEFVLALQTPRGAVHWARDSRGRVVPGALLSGCSSIFKSLECGLRIASTLGEPRPRWHWAHLRLAHAIRCWPGSFPRAGKDKRHFSMDWFYPVLCGAIRDAEGRLRLRAGWDAFVEDGLGCRCVAEQPWVSVAESCELSLALLAVGETLRAARLFSWMHRYRDDDGGYWTGYNFEDRRIWPAQKTTWTSGVVLLAGDGLIGHTPGARLFAIDPPRTGIGDPPSAGASVF